LPCKLFETTQSIEGLNHNNVEWFADAIETGAIKIPDYK
jgi:hypothetical protein